MPTKFIFSTRKENIMSRILTIPNGVNAGEATMLLAMENLIK